MNTIGFKISSTSYQVFSKGLFRRLYVSALGTIYIDFSSNGDIVENDLITITCTSGYTMEISTKIAQSISAGGHIDFDASLKNGINSQISTITYTAG